MLELTATTTADYLRSTGRLRPGEPVEVRELAGGVSNAVLLVTLPGRGERFVLKQARGKLRVKEDWQCSVERIWREVETLRICGELLELRKAEGGWRMAGAESASFVPGVPLVLWEDRENFAYAMTAAPADHRTWKELLLAGELPLSLGVATACGQLLAAIHGGSWNNSEVATRLDDRTFFEALRLDPYYRQIARVHTDLAPPITELIESVWSHRHCLVHGDFSPRTCSSGKGACCSSTLKSATMAIPRSTSASS